MTESILDPELSIIDPHHHLWDLRPVLAAFPEPRHAFLETLAGAAHYTFDQLLADVQTGHAIVATVFMECGAFYNPARGDELKVTGEVEYVNGVAAQSASGLYGPSRYCAGIVGHANLMLGSEASAVLDALQAARWVKHIRYDVPPGQRITAVLMALFTVVLLAQLLLTREPLGYELWAGIFSAGSSRADIAFAEGRLVIEPVACAAKNAATE